MTTNEEILVSMMDTLERRISILEKEALEKEREVTEMIEVMERMTDTIVKIGVKAGVLSEGLDKYTT
jgi:transcriptional regulator